jgi:TonB-dependent starch-binding outer membrane protein SusC
MKFNLQCKVNWKLKTWVFASMCILSFSFSNAQTQAIKGTVNSAGLPLPGASVLIKGTTNATSTDLDGKFVINASPKDVLIFSYVGFVTKSITVGDNTTLQVTLVENTSKLDEVVVFGYGTTKRKDLTGSVVSLKAEDLQNIKTVSFEGTLAAKAAGVQIVTSEGGPGAGFKIKVRGGTSINANNDPLYVIDGFAIDGGAVNTGLGIGNSTTSPLATLDPSNIESIEILKDASSTSLYGSRGANGVILITTKKGKKGRSELNFEAWTGISTISNKIEMLTAQEFVDYRLEYSPWKPDGASDSLIAAYRDQFGNPIDLNNPKVVKTDWQDEITRTAITHNYKLGASGGGENNSYSASFSYLNQEGIIKTSDFERYSANVNVDQNITSKIKTGVSINAGYTQSSGVVSSAAENANGRSGIVTNAILFEPVQGLTRYSDAVYDETGRLISLRSGDVVNPVLALENDINKGRSFNVFGNVYLQYEIAKGFTFKSSVRMNAYGTNGKRYYSEKYGWGASAKGRAYVGSTFGNGITTEQNFNYTKSFGKHGLNVTGVYEQSESNWESLVSSATGFNLPGVNLNSLQSAEVTLPNTSLYSPSALKSYLGRVQYDYSDKWVVNLSGRYDGSSKFAANSKWAFFPAGGLAWKVSNEDFLKDNKIISNLKLKTSYGETGNQGIRTYGSISRTSLSNVILDNKLTTGAAIESLDNKDLTWETTGQFNAGISLGMFDNRISLDADYYHKNTKNLLLEVPLPANTGFSTALKNIGSMTNKGFEFSLNTVNIDKNDFKWTTNFNISFNKNEVTSLGPNSKEFFVRAIGDNQIDNDYVVRVGESIGSIYGIQVNGVYNYSDFAAFDGLSDVQAAAKIRQDGLDKNIPYFDVTYTLKPGVVQSAGVGNINNYRPGLPKYVDQNGDGVVNANDRTIIGRTAPKHFGGMTNNFTYKDFDLSILAQWSYGNDVYNKNRNLGESTAIPYFNKYSEVANRWTPENSHSTIPSVWGYADNNIGSDANSTYIEDGSYLRISNITFGYNLPKHLLKKYDIKSLRFYTAVDNAFIFTKYSGFDPDVSVGNNQLTPGLDADSYPRERLFRFGINVGF